MNIPGWHSIQEFLLTSIRGVDHTLAGNGGVDCYDFLTFKQRLLDTCVFTLLAGLFIAPRVLRNLSLPKEWEIMSMCQKRTAQRIVGFRKFLLIILSVILGIEIGYKIASESWIYLLNPCHVITAIQVSVFRRVSNLVHRPFLFDETIVEKVLACVHLVSIEPEIILPKRLLRNFNTSF